MYNILGTPKLDNFLTTHINTERREKKATVINLATLDCKARDMFNFSKWAKTYKSVDFVLP